jgi:vitamin B12 transporter
MAYNKLFAKDKDGNYLARRPHETFNGSLSYYPSEKLSLNANSSYIGTRYDNTGQTIQTGRYTLWGSAINYDLSDTFTAYVRADNLTDKLYQEANGYGTYGRTVSVGLNAKF